MRDRWRRLQRITAAMAIVAALAAGCDREDMDWGVYADAAKVVRLEPGALALAESGDTLTYRVSLGMIPDDTVRLVLSTALEQFVAEPETLLFTPAAWSMPIEVRVRALNDATAETTVVDTLWHAVATGDAEYAALPPANLLVTVTDDDTPGIVVDPSVLVLTETDDGSETATYELRLATRPRASVTVAVEPGDTSVVVMPAQATIDPATWDQPRQFTVAAMEDYLAEGPHTEVVGHVLASTDPDYDGLTSTDITVEIEDDDVPTLSLSSPAPMLREDLGPFTVRLSLTIPTVNTVLVLLEFNDGLAHEGTDYDDLQELVTIPPGETSVDVALNIIDDAVAEPVENLFARLAEPAVNADIGSRNLLELTILDNERPSLWVAGASGPENGGGLSFRISIDPPRATGLSVNVSTVSGTATSGVDFVPVSREVTIPPQSTGVDVSVTLIADGLDEGPSEFFYVQISATPSLANIVVDTAVGTILAPTQGTER